MCLNYILLYERYFELSVFEIQKVHVKLLTSQSKFSGTRKFTLRYQWFEISGVEM